LDYNVKLSEVVRICLFIICLFIKLRILDFRELVNA
jgi:hypothetical protein